MEGPHEKMITAKSSTASLKTHNNENSHQKSSDPECGQKGRRRQRELLFQLVQAVQKFDISRVEEIVNKGVDIDATIIYSKTPLIYALELRSEDIALLLLDKGANPEKAACIQMSENKIMPIHLAAESNFIKVLEKLIDLKVDLNVKDTSELCSLHYAAFRGHEQACTVLLRHGADVNIHDMHGRTPLHRAVENGKTAVVELLLKSGAAVDLLDNDSLPPLFIATYYNEWSSAKLLIEKSCDVNLLDGKGNSPLHIACNRLYNVTEKFQETMFHNTIRSKRIAMDTALNIFFVKDYINLDLIDMLINSGMNVEAQNKEGLTPLNYALAIHPEVADNKAQLVEKLVWAGSWVNSFTIDLMNPVDDALEIPHDSCYNLLVNLKLQQMSLKHQCKRIIRKSLTGSRNISLCIDEIYLPVQLKTYLKTIS